MKRAHILDTDGGQDRAKEPSEEQAAQRRELIKTLKAVEKYFDPRTEMDDGDESEDDGESEDDEYMVKVGVHDQVPVALTLRLPVSPS